MLRLVLATVGALVAAKTGTTPDPMYEIDAVCANWWHAEGCFDPSNPDADRGWPSDDIEEIFTAALEGREPGRCASCGFGSNVATLPGNVDTSTDCVQCEPPYQLIRLYETTTLAKGGKADKDEDESDGSSALSHSLAAAVVALLAA